jgi:hypothetical protein
MKRLAIGFFTVAWIAFASLATFALEVGEPAPDFAGTSTQGALRLSDLRGQNVVLAIYVADFTPV